jgi:hypothetical protein
VRVTAPATERGTVRRLLGRPASTLLRGVVLASVFVVLTAAPAFAQNPEINHHKTRLWHYWIAPVLVGSGVLIVFALAFGYYWRVVRGR